MADLRLLLSSMPNNEVVHLSAFTGLINEYLQPVDTTDFILQTKSGTSGVFQKSRGTLLVAD